MYHRPSPQTQAVETGDLFRSRLDNMIDMRHPSITPAGKINWSALETA